jgi:peptidoglycan/LPS O-acetylase OafA/YrhL
MTEPEQIRMTSSERGRSFRPDVQGLRALAVLAVVLFHTATPGFAGGFVGVDVFFVISGFLITGNLLRERRARGRTRLGRFYARRLVRLGPAAAATVLGTVAAAHVILPPLDRIGLRTEAVASLVGLENVWLARTATDYLAAHAESPFQQFWSLGVEEQFYLVWAPTIAVLLALGLRRRGLLVIINAGCLLGLAAMVLSSEVNGPWTFFGLHARFWELGVGAALAVTVHERARRRRPARGTGIRLAASGVLPTGLLLLIGSVVLLDSDMPWPGPLTLLPVVGAALVLLPVSGPARLRRALGSPPLRWVGDRSYSIYLVHWPVLVLWEASAGRSLTPVELGIALALTAALAWASHAVFERGVAHIVWGRSERAARRGPIVVATAVAVVAGVSIPATAVPRLAGHELEPAPSAAAVLRGPWSPTAVPTNITPSIPSATDSLPPIYDDGCHAGFDATVTRACGTSRISGTSGTGAETAGPERHGAHAADDDEDTVVLFGDSHAAQWVTPLEALADARGAELVTMTKSSCPSVDLSVRAVELGRPYRECDAWRRDALRKIEDLRPGVVVLANAANSYLDDGDAGAWGAALSRTVEQLRAVGSDVVVLGDTPFWDETPNRCLSASVDDVDACAAPVSSLTEADRTTAQRAAAESTGAHFVDPIPWICDDRCEPVLWNVLVYRDTNHLTEEMARTLTPRLDEAVGPLLS